MRYTDPDGRDIKGAIRAFGKMVNSGIEISGGVSMMGIAAIGEIGTVGLATPVAATVGVIGFATFVDGLVRFGLAASDFGLELADCFKENVPDGDFIPSSLGGMIGSQIDLNNGFNAQKQHKIGPAQRNGEKINAIATFTLGTVGKTTGILENSEKILTIKESCSVIRDEVAYQYDIYSLTKTLTEKDDK